MKQNQPMMEKPQPIEKFRDVNNLRKKNQPKKVGIKGEVLFFG